MLKANYDEFISTNIEPIYEISDETASKSQAEKPMPEFEVFHGDMLKDLDWSSADLVLANSTCFDTPLLNQIAEKCSLLKKGSWMFTLTKRLPSSEPEYYEDPKSMMEWECVISIKREMSWGLATIHVHRKII